MTIWNLPESGRLETQTLDKLALWLAGYHPALSNYQEITNYSTPVTNNATASTLRPLVQDLLQEEWLLEIHQPTNQPAELALAIRLDDQRTAAWQAAQSTLRDALGTLRHTPCALTLTNSGSWTLLDLTESPGTDSQISTFNAQLAATGNPFPTSPTNHWLEADVDLLKLSGVWPFLASFNHQLSTNWPTINFQVLGDGENVRTHAELEFPQPLNFDLDPWNIPTNLIHDPLIGFTAIRGIRPLLKSFKAWNDLQLGTTPNQAFFWALAGMPALEYGAAPLVDPSNVVHKAADRISQAANPWLAANGMGNLARATNFTGLVWKGAPFIEPELRSVVDKSGGFMVAGLIPAGGTNRPPPPELFQSVLSRTNLVFYDWELTAPRLEQWLYLGQLFRLIAHKAQLPPLSTGLQMLKAARPRFGNCVTVTTATDPNHLSLVRRSSLGFNAIELHLLADWLESPEFPRGLHTLLAPSPSPPSQRPGTGPSSSLPK